MAVDRVVVLGMLILLPALVSAGSKIEYPWLEDAGATGGFLIDISFQRGGQPLTFNDTDCGSDPDAFGPGCPMLRHSDGDELVVSYSIDPDNPPMYLDLETADNGNVGVDAVAAMPFEIYVRRCYSTFSKADRPWRKAKDLIRKDKQCKNVKKNIPFGNGSSEVIYSIPADWPLSTNFIRLLVKCQRADGSLDWCHFTDSTSDPGNVLFAVDPPNSRPNGLKIAVGICATLGPIALLVYFLTDNMKKTK